MKVGILGSGDVARALGSGFLRHGFEVMLSSRGPGKLSEWQATSGRGARVGSFADAAAFGDLVVLAVKGSAAGEALDLVGEDILRDKTVIDTTNPIADAPPENGVLRFFTSLDESLMERLQDAHPEARLVKAFNSVGNQLMVNPDFGGVRPTMFICGGRPRQEAGSRNSRGVRIRGRGHGRSRGGARDRAALHPVVHPGVLAEPLGPRVQDAEAMRIR